MYITMFFLSITLPDITGIFQWHTNQNYKIFIEKQIGQYIKVLQMDNEEEYLALGFFLRQHSSTLHHRASPYAC